MVKNLLLVVAFLLGCTTGVPGLLRLQDRELLIHPDKPALAYPHKYTECVERNRPWRWLGKKCFTKHKVDVYDLNKKAHREKLINAGFTCKSKMRFKY